MILRQIFLLEYFILYKITERQVSLKEFTQRSVAKEKRCNCYFLFDGSDQCKYEQFVLS